MTNSKVEALAIMKKLNEATSALRRVIYTQREADDESLGKNLDALELHLDNAIGRASAVFADLVRINRGE